MITANISKTKNELSRYLEAVRGGETVLILDRDRPIARITPLQTQQAEGLDARLANLEGKGLIRRPSTQDLKWAQQLVSPVEGSAKGSLEAMLEERRSGR